MLARRQAPTYDVCIIGSGAGGGMAAYALTQAGASVVMLEAGPDWYASKNSQMLTPAYATPRRGRATTTRPFGEFDACDGGWEIEGEPYTARAGHPLRLVARAHARRPHESLGAHLAALRSRGLQRQDRATGSATTGRSRTRTSRRTTTRSTT